MAVLGAASAPALLAVGFVGASLSPLARARLVRIGGLVVVVLGIVTLLRGIAPEWLHHVFGHGLEL